MSITVTKENFAAEVLQSEIPVLVDFWAVWCGPCRMLAPVLEEIAAEQSGRVKVCKVNVDEEMELAIRYNISAIPAILLFKNGAEAKRSVGVVPKANLLALLN